MGNNDFANYGCGTCATKAADAGDKCTECDGTDNCNAYVPKKYAHKCYSTNTTTVDCTGLTTAGCYTSSTTYTGSNKKLKDFGGCGKCDDATTFDPALTDEEKKSCTSCDGAECNKPAKDSATKASLAGLSLVMALWYLM